MDIERLMSIQRRMDELHGFKVDFSSPKQKYDQITKDLVGLFGEIGEFANLVKKINIGLERGVDYPASLEASESFLRQELVDCFIYILRFGAILEINLSEETLRKIDQNKSKYENLGSQK